MGSSNLTRSPTLGQEPNDYCHVMSDYHVTGACCSKPLPYVCSPTLRATNIERAHLTRFRRSPVPTEEQLHLNPASHVALLAAVPIACKVALSGTLLFDA